MLQQMENFRFATRCAIHFEAFASVACAMIWLFGMGAFLEQSPAVGNALIGCEQHD